MLYFGKNGKNRASIAFFDVLLVCKLKTNSYSNSRFCQTSELLKVLYYLLKYLATCDVPFVLR